MHNSPPGWLFVVPFDMHSAGGVGQVVLNLAAEFRTTEKIAPILLTSQWEARGVTETSDADFPSFAYRLPQFLKLRDPGRFRLFVASALFAPRCLYLLSMFLRSNNVTVVNVHFPSIATLWFVVLKQLGLYRGKLILSFHGSDLTNVVAYGSFGKRLWKSLFRSADACVACSDALAERLTNHFGPSSKIHVVHNGVSIQRFAEANPVHERPGQYRLPDRFIVSVATYEPKKGIDVLLRAFAEFAKSNQDVDLVVAGRATSTLGVLQSLATELGIAERVTLLADVPHVHIAAIVNAADLFVLASRQEPFGIAILEAGVLGKPVVASRVGGIPEIICDERYGMLVPPDDVKALASAITQIVDDRHLAQQLGDNLRTRVCEEFTWQRACEQYLEIAAQC